MEMKEMSSFHDAFRRICHLCGWYLGIISAVLWLCVGIELLVGVLVFHFLVAEPSTERAVDVPRGMPEWSMARLPKTSSAARDEDESRGVQTDPESEGNKKLR